MSAKTYSDDLDHFLDLARHGAAPGASNGERRCQALAQAILDHGPGLDNSAFIGLCQFAALVGVDYPRAERLLRATEGGAK